MFKFWGSQEPEAQPQRQDNTTQSWYPPSVLSSPGSSRPSTPSSTSSGNFNYFTQSTPHVSPSEASAIINQVKDKSVDELRKLLSDKEAYQQFLLSLDQVKTQNKIRDDLRKETVQLARTNLEKEPQMMELRNQCRIIRTTELAAAQEKLTELEKRRDDTLKISSSASLLLKLQEAMNKTDEESEALHRQLLDREIDFQVFVQKYKKLRTTYHKRALTLIAAKTSTG
ncbi:hypothetical protein MLD38_035417 [Melastoma candidum]|uniref:Uncharacterized protein n=1 Tax=Melastoma candidum TaxID=119954 RepID=A0ACB9LH62_9MYRT|nr:hypothetical protein MLD38_035417 [Melastoma candidum]